MMLLVGVVSTNTACVQFRGLSEQIAYNDTFEDFVLGWRNNAWSRRAWLRERSRYSDHPYLHDFAKGFRAGYQAVAAGGNGCPPALPPREYWSWKYQTGEGQAKVAAWFEAFPLGARVAEEEGAGNFQQIAVSHATEIEYSRQFQAGQWPGKVEVDAQRAAPRSRPQAVETLPSPPGSGGPQKFDGAGGDRRGEDVPPPPEAPPGAMPPPADQTNLPWPKARWGRFPGPSPTPVSAPPHVARPTKHLGQYPTRLAGYYVESQPPSRHAPNPRTGASAGVVYPQTAYPPAQPPRNGWSGFPPAYHQSIGPNRDWGVFRPTTR